MFNWKLSFKHEESVASNGYYYTGMKEGIMMKRVMVSLIFLIVLTCSAVYAEKAQYVNTALSFKVTLPEGWKIVDIREVEIPHEKFQIFRMVAASDDRSKIIVIVAGEKDKQNGSEYSEGSMNSKVKIIVDGYKSSRPKAELINSEIKTVGGQKGIWINIRDSTEQNKTVYTRLFVFSVNEVDYTMSFIAEDTALDKAEFFINDTISNMSFVF